MEKLTKAQQDSIKKASTDRLRLNLLKADFAEDEVLLMERDTVVRVHQAMTGHFYRSQIKLHHFLTQKHLSAS